MGLWMVGVVVMMVMVVVVVPLVVITVKVSMMISDPRSSTVSLYTCYLIFFSVTLGNMWCDKH